MGNTDHGARLPSYVKKEDSIHVAAFSMMNSEIDPSALEKESERWEHVAGVVLAGTRRDLDVSQRELAHRLGWSRNMIANIETGRRSMNLGEFIIVARALNVGPEILLQRILRWGHSRRPDSQRLS